MYQTFKLCHISIDIVIDYTYETWQDPLHQVVVPQYYSVFHQLMSVQCWLIGQYGPYHQANYTKSHNIYS